MLPNNIFNFCIFFHLRWCLNDALSLEFLCKTNTSLTPQNVTRASEALEKTAAIIGFSLLTIALIFSKGSETHGESNLPMNNTRELDLLTNGTRDSNFPTNETRSPDSENLVNIKCEIIKTRLFNSSVFCIFWDICFHFC